MSTLSSPEAVASSDLVNELATQGRFPTEQEATDLEDALAQELANLSLVEQEKAMFDVHGIPKFDDDDPPNIEDKLKELDEEVRKTPKKEAFERARYWNKDFVDDPKFRVMFLRCERFDVKLAARKLVKHFEAKKELFGEGEILGRQIRLSDLDKEDLECLESGLIQFLPTRDAAGRSIFCLFPHLKYLRKMENMARTMWYMFNTCLLDEETQKKGVVIVVYNIGSNFKVEQLHILLRIHKIREGIPKKVVGAHSCYEDASLRPFVAGMRLFLDKEVQRRFRPHYGTRETIKFELQTYGIPTQVHPLQENGSISLEWHREWLEVRRIQEKESSTTEEGIIVPRRFDVLFGRGRNTREHTGNLRAAHLVEMYQAKYEVANKYQKTEIAERIVSIIHESCGRFLKWENNGWVEVEHDACRAKIAHFFRFARSKTPSDANPTASALTTTPSPQQTETNTPKRITPCPSPLHLGSSGDAEVDGNKPAKHTRADS